MGGELSEETFLSPAQLAKKIGVSDTPVREAIIQLESEGLVERVPKFGIRARRLDRQELEEMFELRISLESSAAKLAAKRITPEQLNRLRENRVLHAKAIKELRASKQTLTDILHDQVWKSPYTEQAAKLNVLFHLTILAASKNRKLIKIVTDLHVLGKVLRGRILLPGETPIGRLARDYRFHRRILKALETGNEKAAGEWMEKHVTEAMNYHLAAYDWLHQQHRPAPLSREEWSDDILETITQMEANLAGEIRPKP